MELTTHLYSVPSLIGVERYFHPLIRYHGVRRDKFILISVSSQIYSTSSHFCGMPCVEQETELPPPATVLHRRQHTARRTRDSIKNCHKRRDLWRRQSSTFHLSLSTAHQLVTSLHFGNEFTLNLMTKPAHRQIVQQ